MRASTRLWMVGGIAAALALSRVAQQLLEEQRIAFGALDASRAKRLEVSITPARQHARFFGAQRSHIDREQRRRRGWPHASGDPADRPRSAWSSPAPADTRASPWLARRDSSSSSGEAQWISSNTMQLRLLARRLAARSATASRGAAKTCRIVHRVEDGLRMLLALLEVEQIGDECLVLGRDQARSRFHCAALRAAPAPLRGPAAREGRRRPPAALPGPCRRRSRGPDRRGTQSPAPERASATLRSAWTCRCRDRRG